MPELPEVETVARVLRGCIVGEVISEVEVRWARSVACPAVDEFRRELVGRRVVGIARRGKFLVIELQGGFLLAHLRMTGQLILADGRTGAGAMPLDAHTHVLFRFASGRGLRFRDQRKFGRLYWVHDPQQVVAGLGPEPLAEGFTAPALAALLRQRTSRIKPLLLDQRRLAGLGNIYVDESLWEAQIHPLRRAQTLTDEEAARLHGAIRRVLERAIGNRGTTLRDFCDPQAGRGENQEALAVYGRRGEPCPRCGGAIARMVVGQRGTYYCLTCQVL